MFFQDQTNQQKETYEQFLKMVGGLSNLFSDSPTPYLYYRVAEKIFCKAFEAEDLSRGDVSADARKDNLGIGLKTFLAGNHKTFQKVAEFNNDRPLYKDLKPRDLVSKVAELRNARIEFTENAHDLKSSIYHCVLRGKGKFFVFEEPMDKIDIPNIKIQKENKSSLVFDDGKHDYSFLLSKSTLTKRFVTEPTVYDIDIRLLKDPFNELSKLFKEGSLLYESEKRIKQTIFLPLYGRNRTVFEKSGLNQWNAGGRTRHHNEVYIPVPANIHKYLPAFFPDRETPFNLRLPNGKIMKSKICQAGGKALMSYSNKELGEWILRDVLKLNQEELLTYQKLQILGIDSVRVDKIDDTQFEINFSSLGSYERFANKKLNK